MHRDDVRMIQGCQSMGLTGKAFREGRITLATRSQQLERDRTVQRLLPGTIDNAHAAAADEFEDFQLRKRGRDSGQFRNRRR